MDGRAELCHTQKSIKPFWGTLATILDFADGAALQVAGGEQVPTFPTKTFSYFRNIFPLDIFLQGFFLSKTFPYFDFSLPRPSPR